MHCSDASIQKPCQLCPFRDVIHYKFNSIARRFYAGESPLSFKRHSAYNPRMQRRSFLTRTSVIATAICLPAPLFANDSAKVQSLAHALLWLDQLEAAPGVKTSGAWPLSAVLEHLAQSIEMSMEGFPQPKSALFQNTVGSAAFTIFKFRSQMSHSLAEPIPGAPVLTPSPAWRPSAARLRAAIARFTTHSAPLKPHFAYGNLSKPDFAIAHSMHMANHQDEISIHRLA
jgi:Protein of unknown function (DUF1569)